jgi:hypothetical protein
VYYAAGGNLLLLAGLGVAFELRAPRPRWAVALAWVIGAAGIPWIEHRLLGAGSLRTAYLQSLWLHPFFPGAALHGAVVGSPC